MNDWLDALLSNAGQCEDSILVTVAATQGSTPREAGAKMVVGRGKCVGTIGGGQLELMSIELARDLLAQESTQSFIRRFPLGPSLGQCCGGVAEILFERIAVPPPRWVEQLQVHRLKHEAVTLLSAIGANSNKFVVYNERGHGLGDFAGGHEARRLMDEMAGSNRKSGYRVLENVESVDSILVERIEPVSLNIVLFGAGHVAKALVRVLECLDCNVMWVDSREDAFPKQVSPNVRVLHINAPQDAVDSAAVGSLFLVMTHSHPLDQLLCEKILRRDDFLYLGLIGSRSKWVKFEKRFRAQGIPDENYKKITCPIGIDGIDGKKPGEIAIAVAAELLRTYQRCSQQAPQPQRIAVAKTKGV